MITKQQLKQIAPNSKDEIIDPLVQYLNIHMPKYEVNTYLRVCHFLSQAAHESASFRTLEEYASGAAYEGRKDLGNVVKGDGVRYKGRGIFQLTGRANYKDMGGKLGYDLENNPNLAESPEISVLTALEYWKSRGLNKFADTDNVTTITKRINGGLNGFEDRKKYLERAKKIIPNDFKFNPQPVVKPPVIVLAKRGDNSNYVKDLQGMLINKGAKIKADGAFGPATEQAVKDFQARVGLPVTGVIDPDTVNKMMAP
jgi:putative chitinase